MISRERVGSWMAAGVESGRDTLVKLIPSFAERLRELFGNLFDPETRHGKWAIGAAFSLSALSATGAFISGNIPLALITGAPVIAFGAAAVAITLGVVTEDIL